MTIVSSMNPGGAAVLNGAAQGTTRDDIPAERIIDFDFYKLENPEGDLHQTWFAFAQGHPPIFWTPRNGGHWVVTSGEAIKEIQLDHERFSMRYHGVPKGRKGMQSPPIDLDPPRHGAFRALLSQFFSPKALQDITVTIGETIDEIMARVAPLGECEFMTEVARHLPIVVFLRMTGLPLENRELLLEMSEAYMRAVEVAEANAARQAMARYIQAQIDDRRAHPREDLLSRLVAAHVEGRPISEEELRGMCTLLLSGGLDTVKSLLGFSMRFLATNPDHVRQLVESPGLIAAATEELVRRHGIANNSRLVMRDIEFEGMTLREGEMVQIPNTLVGLDPKLVKDPLALDFNRTSPATHAAFGSGPHNCPGARLARIELRMLLEAWLAKIPAFSIKPGTTPKARCGPTNSMQELWLVW